MASESNLQQLGSNAASVSLLTKQYRFVKSAGERLSTFAASASDAIQGVLQNNPDVGQACGIAFSGMTKLVAGAAIAAGDFLTSDSQGRAIPATSPTDWVGAQALEAASGAGTIISALLVQGGGVGAAAAGTGEHDVPFVTAVSQTDRAILLTKPGHAFTLSKLSGFAAVVAGAVSFDAVIVGDNGIVLAGALSIDATPAKFQMALGRYTANGVYVEKAAATAIVFSTNFVVTNNKFGVATIQIDSAGTVTTKVPTTPMAYNDSPTATAAAPAADAGKTAIGIVIIAPTAGDFTANTTALTGISTFTTYAAAPRASAGANSFVSGDEVDATLSGTTVGGSTDNLLLLYTSNGTGVLTDGSITYGL